MYNPYNPYQSVNDTYNGFNPYRGEIDRTYAGYNVPTSHSTTK